MSTLLWLVAIVVAAILLIDAIVFWRKGESATISFQIAKASARWPMIPFAAGVLLGHLFWPNRGYC